MKKIILYYGPKKGFKRVIPKECISLSELVAEHDNKNKIVKHILVDPNRPIEELPIEKTEYENVVAYSDQYAGITESAVQSFLSVLDSYLKQFKNFKLTIKETYPITNAHVGRGGISLDELNMFESKKYPNLYVLGEATDQIGLCGGYNLWYAFTSGIIVADKICK